METVMYTTPDICDQMETVIYTTPDICHQMETVIYATLDACDQMETVIYTTPDICDQMETVINTAPDICDQMEIVIYTILDTCDQNKVAANPQIEKNNAERVNQESSKGTLTTNQKRKNQHTERSKTVIMLGDSMVKHVNGWEMVEKVKK